MSSPFRAAVRPRAATALLAVAALVAGLLTVQVGTAAVAAAASFPTADPATTASPKPLGRVGDGPSPAGASCADPDGSSLQAVVGLQLFVGAGDRVANLGVACAVPAGAPVDPPLTPVTRMFAGGATDVPAATTSCPAGQAVVGLDAALLVDDTGADGDSVDDLRLICAPLDRRGQAYGAVAQAWVRGTAGTSPGAASCPTGTYAFQVNGYADTDHVYALTLVCTSPRYAAAVIAVNLPHSDVTTIDRSLGGSASSYAGARCGDGVVATGVNALTDTSESDPQLGAIGLDCTGFSSGRQPATLAAAATRATTAPGRVDADPDSGECPAGQVVTGLAARIVSARGAPDLVRGLIPYCAPILSDGTVADVDPTAGPEVGTGKGRVVGPVRCPAGQAVTALQVGIVDVGLGGTPGQVLVACAALTFVVPVQAANSSWTTAMPIGANSTTRQASSAPGAALWYRFPVQPSSTVKVDLTDLPTDLDLAVFGDIGQAFLASSDTASLARLSAEFAGVDVAPTTFSPTTFSPTTFSPTTFSPTTFSPTTFSPTTFSPTTFSPTTFSPTTFSPTTFSPTTFSPTTFSPEVTPDQYLQAGTFADVAALAGAFSAAQTRSLLAVSARSGVSPEIYTGETYNRSGYYYLRVTGRDGARSDLAPTLTVTTTGGPCDVALDAFPTTPTLTGTPDSAGTVVLTDTNRFVGSTADGIAALEQANQELASAADAGGDLAAIGPVAVVDVAASERVQALQAQADAHPGCPYAKNLVAQSIRDIVNTYRGPATRLAYVVVEGSDAVVPFFRYADGADVAPESGYAPPVADGTASDASLRNDFVLGQDAYGAAYDLTIGGLPMPVPDVAVGRVVETPAEIATTVDAYVSGDGAPITPTSTLATGYDFLAAGAKQIASSFAAADDGGRNDVLVTDQGVDRTSTTVDGRPSADTTWTAADLRTALFGSRHDVVYLAGHFSASASLAADFATAVTSQELATAPAGNFRNTLVFSAGCHSGYNLVDADGVGGVTDPLDWAQAFAQQGATLVAGTGYQYGDTDFVKYSNQLYVGFAAALRQGSGAVAVGSALVQAKRDYLAGQASIDGIDQKSLLQATVFGLPMQGVDFATGRTPPPTPATPVTTDAVEGEPAATFDLQRHDVTVTPSLTTNTVPLSSTGGGTIDATYLAGPDGAVEVTPAAPALPVVQVNATPPAGTVLRGVGFRSGTYTDTPEITPLTGAPATETNTVHGPFVSDVLFPSRLATPNYFGALGGSGSGSGATRLFVTPAQYVSDAPGSLTTVQRRFAALGYTLFYSGAYPPAGDNQPTTAAAPTMAQVSGVAAAGGRSVRFSTRVVGDPSAGISSAWVTWTVPPAAGGKGAWRSVDLTQSPTDSTLWTGTIDLPAGADAADVRFLVQAVNGVGVVGADDALGAFHRVGVTPVRQPATLVLGSGLPGRVTTGASLPVSARLTNVNGAALGGRAVTFGAGGSSIVAVTDSRGRASAVLPVAAAPGAVDLTASFAGDDTAGAASSDPVALVVGRRTSGVTLAPAGGGGAKVQLSDVTDPAHPVGLPGRTVFVAAAATDGTVLAVRPVALDANGAGTLRRDRLPPGTATLTGWFGAAATPLVGGATFDQTDPVFGAATRSLSLVPAQVVLQPSATTVTAGTSVRFDAFAVYRNYPLRITVPASFTLTPASGGAATGAACNGATCRATAAGTYTVAATYLGVTGTTTVTVTPGPVAAVRVTPSSSQATAGTATAWKAETVDRFGNVVADVSGAAAFTLTPVSGGSSAGAACTANSCSARTAGTYRVTATVAGRSGTARFVVVAAAPAILRPTAGSGQAAAPGTAFPTALAVGVCDRFGNPVAGVRVTFTVIAPRRAGGTAAFPDGAASVTATTTATGTATAPTLTAGSRSGPFVVTAGVKDLGRVFFVLAVRG